MLQRLLVTAAVALFALLVADARAQNYTACGVTSPVAFETWTGSLSTKFPLVFPKTEGELRALVLAVGKLRGCRIRVVGTGGSIDGLVALKQEAQVVVVNLADMQVAAAWDNNINHSTRRVRIAAGKSLLEMMSFIRPLGYLPITRSYGRYFTVGGFYMNPSTHGATFGAERAAKHVTAVRALLSNGKFVNLIQPAKVAEWRGSLGLLGIVVAVEVQLMQDQGILQGVVSKNFSDAEWTPPTVNAWLNTAITGADAVHFFYNFWTNTITGLTAFNNGDPSFNYSQTSALYQIQMGTFPGLAKYGMPKLDPVAVLSQIPAGTPAPYVAAAILGQAESTISQSWLAANVLTRDGYVHDAIPLIGFHALEADIPCPVDCINDGTIFAALSGLRQVIGMAISSQTAGKEWYPTLPAGFRTLTVSTLPKMAIDSMRPGKYLTMEFEDGKGFFSKTGYARVFKRYEQFLKTISQNLRPHLGKEYGMEWFHCDDDPLAFQDDAVVGKIMNPQTKKAFALLMKKYDPRRLFSAGSALRMLGMNTKAFDPRSLLGDTCELNADCAEGCCCNFLPTCLPAGMNNTCVPCTSSLL